MSQIKAQTLPMMIPLKQLTGGHTIEYLASLMQPHYQEVLYVLDSILYVEPTVEDCVARFSGWLKRHGPFKIDMELYNPNLTWLLGNSSDTSAAIYFFRQDIVDALLAKTE